MNLRARLTFSRTGIVAACLATVCILLALFLLRAPIANMQEDMTYALFPSAERAFQYGARHFSSDEPARYDLDRAEYFFNLAAFKDPTLPYVYHELARIDFLRGYFNSALAKITFQINMHGNAAPNSYYIRGLIEGYMGSYANAADSYERYLATDPGNWAALNDYAWVLLKSERFEEALKATETGLEYFPDNAWLWNSKAIALFELARYEEARDAVMRASETVGTISEQKWLTAYPGNDPRTAGDGIRTLKDSIAQNMLRIEGAANE